MNKIVADMHMHTLASGHAYGTIREMAKAAKDKDLKLIGISEHGPGIPGTVEPIYFGNLSVVPRFIEGVEVLHGCEVNVLNDGTLSLDDKHLNYLDYAIAGIHLLCFKNEGRTKNTDNLIACMKHPKVYFISHPDDDKTPLDYERLVKAAKDYHVALEVNNSSLLHPDRRLNCFDNYKKMLELCMQLQAPIIVDSDAHDPSAVGQLDKALELLNNLNFDEDLILNNDIDKLKRFINYQN